MINPPYTKFDHAPHLVINSSEQHHNGGKSTHINGTRFFVGERSATLATTIVMGLLGGGAAAGQQLWSVEEVVAQPGPLIVMDGDAVNAAAAARAPAAETAVVQVEFDYLRLGMGHLDLPLPDGSVIEAANAVFEDRGNGDLMWTGEVPGAGYESVLFTVQDGHLIGWFGEPGGPKYVVHTGPDGKGALVDRGRPAGDWCGAGLARPVDAGSAAVVTASEPRRVASESHGSERLDILLLYTDETVRFWRPTGGPTPGIQHTSDLLNMVFRNGRIPVKANLIPLHWELPALHAPPLQHRVERMFGWFVFSDPDVVSFGRQHRADLVHYLPAYGGGAASLMTAMVPSVKYGFSNAIWMLGAFVHEIGHNLGGGHDPPNASLEPASYIRPYAFGHTDLTSCDEDGGCPHTIMSYGAEARPENWGRMEPFFSSVRHRPNGWRLGIAGERENERVFQETVHVAVRNSDVPDPRQQLPRRISARWTGMDTARVTWETRTGSPRDAAVRLGLAEGGNDEYWFDQGELDPDSEDGMAGVSVGGLRPDGDYRISVYERGALPSDVFRLRPLESGAGSPQAPTWLRAHETGPDSVRLTWSDNSDNETGFTVYRRGWVYDNRTSSERRWERVADVPADVSTADIGRFVAREGHRGPRVGRYSLVVVARNDRGFRASEALDFEFIPNPHQEPTASGEVPDCMLWPTHLVLDGYHVWACFETPDGTHRRAWDLRLESDSSGILYFVDRDNAEVLVKVLDGCGINGHRWVFVAPVTDLGFRLSIFESTLAGERPWFYRWPGNPKGHTARTSADTTAFPCTTAEIATAKAASAGKESGAGLAPFGASPLSAAAGPARSLIAGARTDCEPRGPTLTLRGGYAVSMCYETSDGLVGDARDWGLDSSQSGLLYFFERNNAEVLIKVLDGCGVNGHRWVFVAPVTDLAFNLIVESPSGERWTHANRLGRTANAASDVTAFPCSA